MNKEDLKKLGVADEIADQIIVLHGKDIEKKKGEIDALKTASETVQHQLDEANKQIEAFKGMDIEGIKKSADEYKTKYEASLEESKKAISKMKFDSALNEALKEAKARDLVAVRAHLNGEALKFNEEDGSIVGLNEQLEKIKESSAFLFEDGKPAPRFNDKTQPDSIISDKMVDAARKAAGLPTKGE